MEEAIKKAIEGGFTEKEHTHVKRVSLFHSRQEVCLASVFDDPIFWECLGKALGWKPIGYMDIEYILSDCTPIVKNAPEWQYQMHRFVDHICDGKDVDSYFQELLNH